MEYGSGFEHSNILAPSPLRIPPSLVSKASGLGTQALEALERGGGVITTLVESSQCIDLLANLCSHIRFVGSSQCVSLLSKNLHNSTTSMLFVNFQR